jgi:Lrp/AsnC family leucine-responsive transcriptional regulator
MDTKDSKILHILAENSKTTNADLAKQIGLSESATLERVKRLENQGTIKGYTLRIDPKATQRPLEVLMAITLENQSAEDVSIFVDRMISLEEVLSCAQVLGRFDFMAHVAVADTASLQTLINEKLVSIKNIRRVESLTVIDMVKRPMPPVPLTSEK